MTTSNFRGGLVCNLCIVVDQEFADAYKLKEATEIIIFFRKLIDRISWIFRNIDWNGDGLSDNIGFEVISVSAYLILLCNMLLLIQSQLFSWSKVGPHTQQNTRDLMRDPSQQWVCKILQQIFAN